MAENFEYKSDAFSMLLQNPAYALNVYNSLNDSEYDNPDDLNIYLLENGISLSLRNDASFIIYNHLCVYEHQGSYNPNMAIRELIYFVNLLSRLIKEKKINVYGDAKAKIPIPQFVVFYNGLREQPERRIFRLSDSFEGLKGEPPIELFCEAININPNMNENLKKKSFVLEGYCIFVEKVRKYEKEMALNEALDKAVGECIEEHVLEEFFRERGSEVKKVTELDFTFERRLEFAEEEKQQAIREAKEQAISEGRAEGRAEAIVELLEDLGNVPDALKDKIMKQRDMEILKKWHKLAAKAESMSAFEKEME